MRGRDSSRSRPSLLLFLLAVTLTVIGILFVHSTRSGDESFPSAAARQQIAKAAVALLACFVVTRVDYRWFQRYAFTVYTGLCILLLILLGLKVLDKGRWIDLRYFQVQPSELTKLAAILCLARYLRYRSDYRSLSGLVVPFLLAFAPMVLVLLQPDLGTSLMFPPVLLAMLFVGGARRRYLLLAIAAGLLILPTLYYLSDHIPFFHTYQKWRLVAFFEQSNPEIRRAEAFQLAQSEIALGGGGLWGHGYGQGPQNTLDFLPARHTDFIFSIIGEELGFAGAATIVLLFLLFVLLCVRVAVQTREPFGRLVATGVGVAFAVQSLQNLGMTMGLSPITGLPLPFVSFGGSSLVTSYLALGLVLNVSSRRVHVVASKDLDPQDTPRVVRVFEDQPAGSIYGRWPV